jgi:hypothetical protein
MSEELVVIQPGALQTSNGAAVNFRSRFANVKPATLVINQPNTQVEGALKGKLRIVDSNSDTAGQQFDEMFVTLLCEPQESRWYYEGQPGELNRTKDNLMCFSYDMIRPDSRPPQQGGPIAPGALKCDGCPKASWDKWRITKKKEDLPKCEPQLRVHLIDSVYRIPLVMYLRSKSKQSFEDGMQAVARLFLTLKAQGKSPNWYDVKFRLGTKLIKSGNFSSFVPTISNVTAITDDERAAFGETYLQYINSRNQTQEEEQSGASTERVAKTTADIDAQIAQPSAAGNEPIDGEYVTV